MGAMRLVTYQGCPNRKKAGDASPTRRCGERDDESAAYKEEGEEEAPNREQEGHANGTHAKQGEIDPEEGTTTTLGDSERPEGHGWMASSVREFKSEATHRPPRPYSTQST
jgi:hypothetical protein